MADQWLSSADAVDALQLSFVTAACTVRSGESMLYDMLLHYIICLLQ